MQRPRSRCTHTAVLSQHHRFAGKALKLLHPESMSDAESSGVAESSCAGSLAIVPFTPDDSCAPTLRRSSREHKKPRPYYAESQAEPPDKPSTSKGLQRGFLK